MSQAGKDHTLRLPPIRGEILIFLIPITMNIQLAPQSRRVKNTLRYRNLLLFYPQDLQKLTRTESMTTTATISFFKYSKKSLIQKRPALLKRAGLFLYEFCLLRRRLKRKITSATTTIAPPLAIFQ